MATTKVNTEFIAVNAISGTIIADNAITATHIATNAISGTLVQNGGIVTTMIAANNITSTKIVTDAVLTRHIADDQVTADKLANSINTDIAAKLPLAGGTMTGALAGTAATFSGNIQSASFSAGSSNSASELLYLLGSGHTGHGASNTVSLASIGESTSGNTMGLWFGSMTNENTGVIGTRTATGNLAFQTYSGGWGERMRITYDGKVGIGQTSPSADLHISGDQNRTCIIERNNGSEAVNLAEMLTHQALTIFNKTSGSYLNFAGNAAASQIQAQSDGSTAEDIALNPYGGNVGIGTTSPGAKLEVNGKDDAGAGDLIRLIFDNSPADTGITFADINSTIKNRISMDASNTNDLYISTGTEMKFFCGTTGTSTTQVMHLKKINSNISTVHVGNGVIGPSSDITYRAQGSGENWRWGSNVSNSHSYWINSSSAGVYMTTGSTSWSSHSDERLKENITPLGEVLPSLLNMRCVKFNRKGDSGNTKVGFIAQDWEGKGFDEVVDEDTGFTIQDDGTLESVVEEDNTSTTKPKSIAYTETIPLLLKAIQELEARVKELEG